MLDFIVFKRYPSSQKRKLFTSESQLWYWDEIGCPVRANKKPSIPIFGVHAINQSYPNNRCDEDLKQLSPCQKTTHWWRTASNCWQWNAQFHPCVYSQHHSCSGLTSKNEIKLEDRLRLRERRKKSKSHHIADPFFWSQELNCCIRSL